MAMSEFGTKRQFASGLQPDLEKAYMPCLHYGMPAGSQKQLASNATTLDVPPMLAGSATSNVASVKWWRPDMSDRDMIWQERRLEEILFSNTDANSKVQQIIRLGFEPETADALVERHQMGMDAPVYYETLDFKAEYEPSEHISKRRQDPEEA